MADENLTDYNLAAGSQFSGSVVFHTAESIFITFFYRTLLNDIYISHSIPMYVQKSRVLRGYIELYVIIRYTVRLC